MTLTSVPAIGPRAKQAILLALDLAAALVAVLVALALLPGPQPRPALLALTVLIPAMAAALGLHRIKLITYGSDGILRSAALAVLTAIAARALARLAGEPLSDPALIVFALLFLLCAVAARWALLHLYLALLHRQQPRRPVIIYGAGATGLQLAAALAHSPTTRPVALLDDNPALHGMNLAGLRVHAPAQFPSLAARHQVGRVILAMPRLPEGRRQAIAQRLRTQGSEVLTVPSFDDLPGETPRIAPLIPVEPERFLNRPAVTPALPRTIDAYAGRSLLVTGAGGSIGAELCRQVLAFRPDRLVLFDSSEHALYTVDKDLRPLARETRIVPLLGNVTDPAAVQAALADHRVETVLHAAALKHVPLVERNPIPAVETNVFGTRVVAEAAASAGVARVVFISTDKAVRPSNVMGATKHLAERVVQDIGRRAPATGFAIVRFGNVLGSSGSVVPLFREQIARGGPVTLTHPDVTRYVMTLSEAAQLVLATGAMPLAPRDGADVFVLDMGAPVRIRDLALQMIAAAGLRPRSAAAPDGDIEITVTGLRPGEKLHEELLLGADLLPTPHPRILRAGEAGLSELTIAYKLRHLRQAIAARDETAVRTLLFQTSEPLATGRAGSRQEGHAAPPLAPHAALRH